MSSAAPSSSESAVKTFIDYWSRAGGSERSNYALFLDRFCELLGLPRPEASTGNSAQDTYVIDKPVTFKHPDGSTSTGFIDCYKRGCFVCETKQGIEKKKAKSAAEALAAGESPDAQPTRRGHGVRGTKGWDDAMIAARGQAESYVKAIPDDNPPFVVVMDVGYTIELYADFSRLGKGYFPFPDAQSHRIRLDQLADPEIRERLALLWTDPLALDPARQSAKVTREIAANLAELSKSLEKQGHHPEHAAHFLMRCLFTLFAEDVGILGKKKGDFTALLKELESDPDRFPHELTGIWKAMNVGDYSPSLRARLLKFNGGLFAETDAPHLHGSQIRILKEAAEKGWEHVEPAIFGTLLERALDPDERHKLGAHFTPRAYVERLVLPTIIEPLREELDDARTAALAIANRPIPEDIHSNRREKFIADQMAKAREPIYGFLRKLCKTIVLDPACGTGNFLYVAMAKMKDLEGEANDLLRQFGDDQFHAEQLGLTVDPHQFLGIEINPRAAAIADLVLWIGYLQWHFRTHGNTPPREPVLKAFDNIRNADAVLAYDKKELVTDEHGKPVTRWDGKTMKKHPVTGEDVPDESARVPVYRYVNPRKAEWPKADYVVGNPPFLGKGEKMREALGDGYVEALRDVTPEVPGSSDYVSYWWNNAAQLAAHGSVSRFGLITTNSIKQTFNRKVIENHLAGGRIGLVFAIPDHPWVDSSDGAAVRIAMTVGERDALNGTLATIQQETEATAEGFAVELVDERGVIHSDLTIGAPLTTALELRFAEGLTSNGVMIAGSGFILSHDDATRLGLGTDPAIGRHIRPYRNGRDLAGDLRGAYVIDLFGLDESEVRKNLPHVYQWVTERVRPERAAKKDRQFREKWWLFGRSRPELRIALSGLSRYIATVETSKHRFFLFLDSAILPDHKVVCFAVDDAYALGVMSSALHVRWALAQGSTLEDRPVYPRTRCFDTFPFPTPTDAQKARIRELGEQLDAHRKRQQAAHPGLTITDMYNVLEKLRAMDWQQRYAAAMASGKTPPPPTQFNVGSGGSLPDGAVAPISLELTAKEKKIHEQGLVSVLKQIHDDLDAAVFDAYGWPHDLSDEQILERLVALNHERAEEEKGGLIRWLRPEFQQARVGSAANNEDPDDSEDAEATPKKPKRSVKKAPAKELKKTKPKKAAKLKWPKTLAEQARAVREALLSGGAGTVQDITNRFSRAEVEKVKEILDTLATLGQARRAGNSYAAS